MLLASYASSTHSAGHCSTPFSEFFIPKFIPRQFGPFAELTERIADIQQKDVFLLNIIGGCKKIRTRSRNSLLVGGQETQANVLPLGHDGQPVVHHTLLHRQVGRQKPGFFALRRYPP
jgi:hypothetical protein